jgi:phosphoribosylamine-glycine ligase
LKVKNKSAATVVMAAGGYPGGYKSGTPMTISSLLPESKQEIGTGMKLTTIDVVLFHAGTKMDETSGEIVTAGGRVIASTAVADTLNQAIKDAYKGVDGVRFEGMQFRGDIGARALK